MALIGHHFFDVRTAPWRLAKLWPNAKPAVLTLKTNPGEPRPVDAEACSAATSLYAGNSALTAEDFSSLIWLDAFARSGRQLLMCHALRLLEGWSNLRRPTASLMTETDILKRLAIAAPDFAALLNPNLLSPFAAALQAQANRVNAIRPKTPTEALNKALALLQSADVLQDGQSLTTETSRLLEQALPQLVGNDGGPTRCALSDYVSWIEHLMAANSLPFAPLTRNALDRAAPFLSMLVGADGRYCFDTRRKPQQQTLVTEPLQLARNAQVARVSAGKTVVIAIVSTQSLNAKLCLSSHGHHLFNIGSISGDIDVNTVLEIDHYDQGQVLELATASHQRSLFLSPKGDDIRVEELLSTLQQGQSFQLTLNPEIRISLARNGMQATLAVDSRNLWQLTLRGGVLVQTHDDHILHINPTAKRINWAFKRIGKPSPGRTAKPDIPELPF